STSLSRRAHPTGLYTLSLHDALPILDDGTIFAPTFSSLVHVAELVDVRVPPGIRFRLRRLGRGDDPVCVARGGVPHNPGAHRGRSEEHTSELQSRFDLVCRLLLEKQK